MGSLKRKKSTVFIKNRSEYHRLFINLLLKIAPGLCSQHENRNNFDHSMMPFEISGTILRTHQNLIENHELCGICAYLSLC